MFGLFVQRLIADGQRLLGLVQFFGLLLQRRLQRLILGKGLLQACVEGFYQLLQPLQLCLADHQPPQRAAVASAAIRVFIRHGSRSFHLVSDSAVALLSG